MAPVQIKIGNEEGNRSGLTMNSDITQTIKVLDNDYEKYENLFNLLVDQTKDAPKKVIIFCKTKKGVDRLE